MAQKGVCYVKEGFAMES